MGGNPAGLPVVVIGLEKDDFGPVSGGTVFFADRTGLDVALDDSAHDVLAQFFPRTRGERGNDSDFVILNGVRDSASHELWEILYARSRRPLIAEMRELIDSVEAPGAMPELPPAEPARLVGPQVRGAEFEFWIEGTVGRTARIESSSDGVTWETRAELLIEEGGTRFSQPLGSGHGLFRVVTE